MSFTRKLSRVRWRTPKLFYTVLPCLLLAHVVSAQVRINEILADNQTAVANGGQFSDYLELHNAGGQAVSLAGMSLTDDPAFPRFFVFPAGAQIPAGGYLVVWCDLNTQLPGYHTGFGLGSKGDRVMLYAADGFSVVDEISFGLQVPDFSIGRNPAAPTTWTLTTPTPQAGNIVAAVASGTQLRLNEWMARPLAGEDWIEVFNMATQPVALGGLVVSDVAVGTPANRAIPGLSYIGGRGFVQFFASDLVKQDADHLDFKLGSAGETLSLYGADRATVLDRVTFGAQSSNISQGRAPDGAETVVFFPEGGATPGKSNFQELTSVVISEVLTHSDPPYEDAIELLNTTAAPIDISNWWLSDSGAQPRKYRIPAGTTIPANGYRVFYQYQFDAGIDAFSLNSYEGDDVFLSTGDASGNLTGFQTSVKFGALANGISVGRYQTSLGADFVPLATRTFGVSLPSSLTHFRQGNGAANTPALIGPVVISEIMFRPPDVSGLPNTDDEFLEIHNRTGASVPLYDPVYPTNTWRIRDGVTYDFPMGVSIPAGGYLLLVSFDPVGNPGLVNAFRSKYSVPATVPLYGPYSGKLSDSGEAVELLEPDTPQQPGTPVAGFVPYMVMERIAYTNSVPWPGNTAGTGNSLQRKAVAAYGNDPANWVTAVPTAGSGFSGDSDADGMPDQWEMTYGFNHLSGADAVYDADGDGAHNLAEYRAGTHPLNGESVLRLLGTSVAGNNVVLEFMAVAGKAYSVLQSPNVAGGAWSKMGDITASATGALRYTNFMTYPAGAIFRVVTPPQP